MKLLKRLLLTAAGLVLAGTSHADARPHIFRRVCCQPAPAPQPVGQLVYAAPPVLIHPTAIPPSLFPLDGYQRIAPPSVPVPAIPPGYAQVVPAATPLAVPLARPMQQFIGTAVQRVCGPQGCR